MKKFCLFLAALLLLGIFPAGCARLPENEPVTVTLSGDGLSAPAAVDLAKLAGDSSNVYSGLYSSINNWPTKKVYTASGVTIDAVLKAAGVPDGAYTLSFISSDGYKVSFTDAQWRAKRFYFPGFKQDNPSGAVENRMILATESAKDTENAGGRTSVKPTLMFGQQYLSEHTNVAFVEDVARIELSSAIPAQWESATCFPLPGTIEAGDTVKLEHPDIGLVKLYYTTDGQDPTEESAMYNVSTYQPELNLPIKIEKDTVIKVLAAGYGKQNSEIAVFRFTVK